MPSPRFFFLALLPLCVISCGEENNAPAPLLAESAEARNDSLRILSDTADSRLFRHSPASLAPFRNFYAQLGNAQKDKQLLRILHYGDSQIEADRITGAFREKTQERFGGAGVGLLPLAELSEARACVLRKTSRNWTHHDLRTKKDKNVQGGRYGYGCTVQEMTVPAKPGPNEYNEAWVQLKANPESRPNERKAERFRLFYRNTFDNASYVLQADTHILAQGELDKSSSFSTLNVKLNSSELGKLQLTLAANKSPEIFGMALDGESGVAVDNISLRGSSAIEFTNMDTLFLREQLKSINAGLIIFQFGANLVPGNAKDYGYYEELFYKQLSMFRRMAPGAAVLVIGVPDMARKEKGKYASYPSVEKVLQAQRRAAERSGCAFWNLYSIMGGKNSMITWHKNGLANRDFVHFSNKGAAHVGELLYDALLKDYQRFKHPKEEKEKLAAR